MNRVRQSWLLSGLIASFVQSRRIAKCAVACLLFDVFFFVKRTANRNLVAAVFQSLCDVLNAAGTDPRLLQDCNHPHFIRVGSRIVVLQASFGDPRSDQY